MTSTITDLTQEIDLTIEPELACEVPDCESGAKAEWNAGHPSCHILMCDQCKVWFQEYIDKCIHHLETCQMKHDRVMHCERCDTDIDPADIKFYRL